MCVIVQGRGKSARGSEDWRVGKARTRLRRGEASAGGKKLPPILYSSVRRRFNGRPEKCREMAARARRGGAGEGILTVPGAAHVLDDAKLKPRRNESGPGKVHRFSAAQVRLSGCWADACFGS
jgi:hypothetical protein